MPELMKLIQRPLWQHARWTESCIWGRKWQTERQIEALQVRMRVFSRFMVPRTRHCVVIGWAAAFQHGDKTTIVVPFIEQTWNKPAASSFNSMGSDSANARCAKWYRLSPTLDDFYDVVFCCFYLLNNNSFSASLCCPPGLHGAARMELTAQQKHAQTGWTLSPCVGKKAFTITCL